VIQATFLPISRSQNLWLVLVTCSPLQDIFRQVGVDPGSSRPPPTGPPSTATLGAGRFPRPTDPRPMSATQVPTPHLPTETRPRPPAPTQGVAPCPPHPPRGVMCPPPLVGGSRRPTPTPRRPLAAGSTSAGRPTTPRRPSTGTWGGDTRAPPQPGHQLVGSRCHLPGATRPHPPGAQGPPPPGDTATPLINHGTMKTILICKVWFLPRNQNYSHSMQKLFTVRMKCGTLGRAVWIIFRTS